MSFSTLGVSVPVFLTAIVLIYIVMAAILESFIHPRIGAEFMRLVQQYVSEDANAIIQVVVPLLIETNMHPMFRNILMVYASEEEQKRRLIERAYELRERTAP